MENFTNEEILDLLNLDASITNCLLNCSNNGECIFTNDGHFGCNCIEHFTGARCEFDKRICSFRPCINEGQCHDVIRNGTYDFVCKCSPFFYGTYCQFEVNICQEEKCSSNGICKDKERKPICECFKMYSGEHCEIESSELKTMKTAISFTSVLSIIILVLFYLMFILIDLSDKFCGCKRIKEARARKNKHHRRYRYLK